MIMIEFTFFYRLLTGKKVDSMTALSDAILELHKVGPKIVAVSSCDIDNKLTSVTSSIKGVCTNGYVITMPLDFIICDCQIIYSI